MRPKKENEKKQHFQEFVKVAIWKNKLWNYDAKIEEFIFTWFKDYVQGTYT